MDKKNLVIVITGAGKGLGKYLAENFLNQGNIVNVMDIVEEKTARSKIWDNERFNYYLGDVSNQNDVKLIFEKIYNKHKRLDVLINNAAIRYFSLLQETPLDDMSRAINVNLKGLYITTQEALKYMRSNGYGRIVNISSNSSFKGYSTGSIYCATKAAANIFTEAVSKELNNKYNITINSICPGRIGLNGSKEEGVRELIPPELIFKAIYRIINSKINGETIPLVSPGIFLFNITRQLIAVLKQIKYFLWKYLI